MPVNFRIFGWSVTIQFLLFCVCFLGKNYNQWKCTNSHFLHSSCSSFVWHLFLFTSILGTDFLVSECLLLHIIKSSSYSGGRGGSGEWRLDWCFLLFFHFSRTLHFLLTSFLLLSRLQRAVSFSPLPPAMFLWCCYFCPSLSHTLPTVSVINYQDSSLWPYFACCMGTFSFCEWFSASF